MNAKQKDQREAILRLREMVKPGDTLFTVVRSVSRSGMSRKIDVYAIHEDQPLWLSRFAARALGWTFDERSEAIRVDGCGMDMGFHLVYELATCVFVSSVDLELPQDSRLNRWRKCLNDYQPKSAGYALSQRWMQG